MSESLRSKVLVLEEKLRDAGEYVEGAHLFQKVMSLRRCRGSATTINSFKQTVHDRFDEIIWTKGKGKGKGKDKDDDAPTPMAARNQYGDVWGYTFDAEDLNRLAGNKAGGFRWLWEPGNYVLTDDSVYFFL